MDEIKFRGKDIKDGEWVYGYYVKSRKRHYILQIWDEGGYDERWGASEWVEVASETVGQCTGLKDGDEEEIFKGDILLSTSSMVNFMTDEPTGEISKVYSEVVWSYAASGWCEKSNGRISPFTMNPKLIKEYCKVVGNVNDNPELLKEHDDTQVKSEEEGSRDEILPE